VPLFPFNTERDTDPAVPAFRLIQSMPERD
jgi:hypothetical protein